jgi:hypothetical protein
MGQQSVRQAARRAALDEAARCREGVERLRTLEGLALECGAGDLTAAHSAKSRAIAVPKSMLPGSAKLTDRPGILLYKSVVEYVQLANWDWIRRCNIVWTPVFGRDLRRAIGDTRTCD